MVNWKKSNLLLKLNDVFFSIPMYYSIYILFTTVKTITQNVYQIIILYKHHEYYFVTRFRISF